MHAHACGQVGGQLTFKLVSMRSPGLLGSTESVWGQGPLKLPAVVVNGWQDGGGKQDVRARLPESSRQGFPLHDAACAVPPCPHGLPAVLAQAKPGAACRSAENAASAAEPRTVSHRIVWAAHGTWVVGGHAPEHPQALERALYHVDGRRIVAACSMRAQQCATGWGGSSAAAAAWLGCTAPWHPTIRVSASGRGSWQQADSAVPSNWRQAPAHPRRRW